MKEVNNLILSKSDEEEIIVPLSFHDSKKYGNTPILISQDVSEKLTIRADGKKYFEIKNILRPNCKSIYFQLYNRNIVDNLNINGISILDCIVRNSGWPMIRQDVQIKRVKSINELELSTVELSLPEIHISARDLWYYERSLIGEILYNGISPLTANNTNDNLPINITSMTIEDREYNKERVMDISGLVTENTSFIIRPRSVRIIIIIVISREFFQYSGNGFKWWRGIISFFQEYLTSNKQVIEHHYVTILFTYKIKENDDYMDYYQIFWEGILSQLTVSQTSINEFIENLRLKFNSFGKDKEIIEQLTSYCESNILESINFTLTQLQNDLIDGSLIWTGRNIKILSSGPPIITSDLQNYPRLLNLSKITEVRFLKTSITCDFISFSELDWYHSLYIYIVKIKDNLCRETLKIIGLKLPIIIYYYRMKQNYHNNDGIFNLSSTITLLDDYIRDNNQFNDYINDTDGDMEFEENDIDLIINNQYNTDRISSNVNNQKKFYENSIIYNLDSKELLGRLITKSGTNNYINDTESLSYSLGPLLLPLTTSNLSKIGMEDNLLNAKSLFAGDIQRIANWTITPRKELFFAYYWNNYLLKNYFILEKNISNIKELSIFMDKPEFKYINEQILRLIFYDLIVHRMSMSFQISTIKSKNIVGHYNAENIQMLKCYNSTSKYISPNYDFIHQLCLLKEDNNILVEVINISINENNNSDNSDNVNDNQDIGIDYLTLCKIENIDIIEFDKNHGLDSNFNFTDNKLLPIYILKSKSNFKKDKMEFNTSINSEIINYKYEYYISRNKQDEHFFKCYTIFNSLSNVNYNYVDEILVWQREIPFINELINESLNELLNYHFDKNNFDYYYLLTSYISGLSIRYMHFSIIPYINIDNKVVNINKIDDINTSDYLNCYSNNYKDCCTDYILNSWLKLTSVNNEQLKEIIEIDFAKENECLNIKNLKKYSQENIKKLVKSLEFFFFQNAPPEHSRSLEIEIMNDENYSKNCKKSSKILASWCESSIWNNQKICNKEVEFELREKHIVDSYHQYGGDLEPINWFVLYYDSIWHPLIPFRISIGWISCPTLIISRIVRKIKSLILNYYFTLIQLRSSEIYSSYEISLKPSISSYTPLNPPIIIKFDNVIPYSNIKSYLKMFMSFPLSLQLIYFDQSNLLPRFFLTEPHSIYSLEFNSNAIIIRLNYYQVFWKHHFQYDSSPVLKCSCSSLSFNKSWRNQLLNSHLNFINKMVINMQVNM